MPIHCIVSFVLFMFVLYDHAAKMSTKLSVVFLQQFSALIFWYREADAFILLSDPLNEAVTVRALAQELIVVDAERKQLITVLFDLDLDLG